VPGTIRKLLKLIAHSVDADGVHLFQVKLNSEGTGAVGLKFNSGSAIDVAVLLTLQRFQFHLFSGSVQDALLADNIAIVTADTLGGGRIVSGLIKLTKCACYVLCPIKEDGRLKGILGIACRQSADEHDREFFELLKLNGGILLSHVLRTQRERSRRRKLRQWRKIANQACDFAIGVDERLQICSMTEFGAGTATPKLKGLRLIDVVTRNFHADVENQIGKAVTSGRVRTCDFQISLGHEGPRWYLARIEPSVRNEDVMATLYLTDNNPDKVLQEEVRLLTDQLVKASRLSLLGQMSTEFSHQLKQPLQAILTYCNMLQRRIIRGTFVEKDNLSLLNNIEKSVEHSAEIIESIRDFVRFRSLKTERVSLLELIDQSVVMVIPTARGWNADLVAPVDPLDVFVDVDKAQTTHVLVNLMINALEACCEFCIDRPRVELFIRENVGSRTVTVAIKDNGPGLPVADPNVVFGKFYSSKKEGLGMGLAISRDVCESQGGSLMAINNDGESGCTFLAKLPLVQDDGNETEELKLISDIEIAVE